MFGNKFEWLKPKKKKQADKVVVKACISGEIIPDEEIKDETFASGVLGKGIGIIPAEETVTAPCDAVVSAVMEDTRHAVCLTLENGAEILIHEGIDTVQLEGEGFQLFVKSGDHVKRGEPLLRFDSKLLKEKQYDSVTVMLLTNPEEFENFRFIKTGEAHVGETVVLEF